MNKTFMIIAVAVLLVGAFAYLSGNQVIACGQKSGVKTTSTEVGSSCPAAKANVQIASATSTCAGKADVQTASATEGCVGKANAQTASASSSCTKSVNASYASATEKSAACAVTCSKEECVNWLMANKDMTREQAEAAFQYCAKSKAAAEVGIKLAAVEKEEAKVESESSTDPAGPTN